MVGALFLFGKRGLNLLHATIRRHSPASSARGRAGLAPLLAAFTVAGRVQRVLIYPSFLSSIFVFPLD